MMKTKLHAAWRRINAFFPKKLLASGLCALVLLGSPAQAPGINQTPSEDMLRLHVVAASDSAQDQALKLQLRDRLLPIIQGYIQEARSARQAEALLRQNLDQLSQQALSQARALGHEGEVTVSLRQERFPNRVYAGMSVPAGEYQALRVTLGPGEVANWWCVLYPSLCLLEEPHQTASPSPQESIQIQSSLYDWLSGLFATKEEA